MNDTTDSTPFSLELTAEILIRCFWMGLVVLAFWFVGFTACGNWAFAFHKQLWTGITQHEFDLINLVGMTILKSVVFVGFLFPYLGIRMVLRKEQQSS